MNIPDKVIDRLTLYHYILDDFDKEDREAYISSTQIADLLNIDDSQVRKDIKVWNENLIGSFLQFTRNSKDTVLL